jgi:Tfp pilus assembly protein PilF
VQGELTDEEVATLPALMDRAIAIDCLSHERMFSTPPPGRDGRFVGERRADAGWWKALSVALRDCWRCNSRTCLVGRKHRRSEVYLESAKQYIAQGNLSAAEIELRNAVRDAPQDPALRVRLAEVYMRLGEAALAEREAQAARERGGSEADFVPVLLEALLAQRKFSDLADQVQPSNRDPALESKIRTALATAVAYLQDRDKAETLLREAIEHDPSAVRPKIR